MAAPAERFSTAAGRGLSRSCCRCGCPPSSPWPRSRHRLRTGRKLRGSCPGAGASPGQGQLYAGGPVEFERVVPASGNMEVAGQAVLARHRPLRDDSHLLGRHRRHPPDHRRGPGQVRPLAPVRRGPGCPGGSAADGQPGPPPLPPAEPGISDRGGPDRQQGRRRSASAASTSMPRRSSAAGRSASASRRRR